MSLPILTSSRAKSARACLRLHKLRYLDGWTMAPGDNQRFGTLVHAGLEEWWKAAQRGSGERLAVSIAAVRSLAADAFEAVRAESMLVGYEARWGERAADYEVLGVESEFSAPLVNPLSGKPSMTWMLGGKIDAIVRELATGRVLVVEHKTSSEDIGQGSEYWRRLRMDGQVSIYFEGATSLGHDVAGCLYDVLGKPGIKPSQVPLVDADGVKIVYDQDSQRVRTKDGKKWRESADAAQGFVVQTRPETVEEFRARLMGAISESPDRYYQRGEVSRMETERESAMVDVWQLAQQLREAERLGRAPRNPDSCMRYGRLCEFFPACSGEASLENDPRFTKQENVNPELSTKEVAV